MRSLLRQPMYAAALLTAGSVLASLAVTALVLVAIGASDFTIGLLLAGLLPAAMAPGPTYMLVSSNARLRQMHDEMERQANTDLLTGLPNRRAFFAKAPGLIAGPGDSAVLVLDLDHFKRINDTHGHAAGDTMLHCVGRVLAAALRKSDAFVARLGGEEFAAILPGAGTAEAEAAAERICRAVRRLRVGADHGEGHGHVTASVGVAMVRDSALLDEALRLADDAVYLAKRSGRDQWIRAGAAPRPTDRGGRRVSRSGQVAA